MVAEVKTFARNSATIITDPATEDCIGVVRLFALGLKKANRPTFYQEVEEIVFDVVIPVTIEKRNQRGYIQSLVDYRELPYTIVSIWKPETNEPF